MLGSDCFDRLEFNQNFPLDEKIGVKIFDDLRAEAHFNRFLPLDGKAGFGEGYVGAFS